MNVVFWGYLPGLARVSSTILSVALTTVTRYRTPCSVLQLQHNNNLLIPSLLTDELTDSEFGDNGVDALIRRVNSGTISKEDVEGCSFSFIEKRLNIFTTSKLHDEHIYNENILRAMPGVFEALDGTFKINFIDVPAGDNPLSREALNLADLIVVCLPQSVRTIESYLANVHLPKEKVFYVISDYDSHQYLTKSNIAFKYGKGIKSSNLGVVPHCPGFSDAINRNKVISFMAQNENCKKSDKNYNFIKESAKTAERILKRAGVNV